MSASELANPKINGAASSSWRIFFQRHPLIPFFFLAFLLSWYPYLLSLTGVRTSGGINPLGPFVSAMIITGITRGRTGLKKILQRIVLWRVNWKWYALVIALPILISAAAMFINVLFGAVINAPADLSWKSLPEQFIFILLFIGLGEEPGWRGFALPQLQTSRSPIRSSLILALFWAIWHLPLFGTEFHPAQYGPFLISLLAATFLMTWIYNHTRGSILLPMIFHASVNAIGAGYFYRMFAGSDLDRMWWICTFFWTIATLIVILTPSSGILRKGLSFDDLNS
jgi:membrane protease YdiL (CAAX protease family)